MRFYLFFYIFCFSYFSFSQTIKGKIENAKGEKILVANVIVKDSVGTDNILEFVIARNGSYDITLQKEYKKFVIEITANGYAKEYIELKKLVVGATYTQDFVLFEQNEEMEEITVIAEKKPFSVSEDTTKFDVKGYSDGTERKIEEIIKKLPGLQVNDKTGEITYKNKSIETIKLDGDDLFGANYSIGSRNINVNMVEQIQAIENYSDNPLLKGIENSDKVILNLKLRKSLSLSGNLDFGNGIMEDKKFARHSEATLLAVTQKYKSFTNLSYNNIGVNLSPFNYFDSFNYTPEQANFSSYTAKKLINEYDFSSILDEKRVRINQSFFGSHNQIFKFSQKISLKSSTYYISDKIKSVQDFLSSIQLNGRNLETRDLNTISKEPKALSGDAELSINTSKKSLFSYKISSKYEYIFIKSNLVQNNSNYFETSQNSYNLYLKQSLLFTNKISDKKALQISLNHFFDKISQTLFIHPTTNTTIQAPEIQEVNNSKNTIESKITLLGTFTKKRKYSLSFGINSEHTPIFSKFENILTNDSSIFSENFKNDLVYQKDKLFSEQSIHFFIKNWKISLSNTFSFLHQYIRYEQKEQDKSKESIFLEPNVHLSYKISDVSSLGILYNYTQKPFTEEYLFKNPIIQSARLSTKNIPDLQFAKTHFAQLNYGINDLYNQVQILLGSNFVSINGSYFSNLNIENNLTQITFFYLPQNVQHFNVYFSIEKFFYKLLILVKFYSNYGFQNYKNILNNSELRDNQMQIFTSKLELKTGFKSKLNFQNAISFVKTASLNAGNTLFPNKSITNYFKALYKHKKNGHIHIEADYFLPNIENTKENYFFVDFGYSIVSKNKNLTADFSMKNILNVSNFEQINNNDYSFNIFRTNLLGRYGMIKISLNL